MITPGILENLRIINAIKNDKGTLVITIQQGDGSTGGLLASLGTLTTTSESNNDFFIWPLKADERKTTPTEIVADLIKKIEELRNHITHILEQYMPIKGLNINPIEGLSSINSDADFQRALEDTATRDLVLAKVYDNYVTGFIKYITPFMGPGSTQLRGKFTRASKDKHFPSFPKFLPFFEPMTVPASASKLKYTDYELGFRKGDTKGDRSTYTGHDQSDPTPVSGDAAASGGNSAESAAVNQLFGAK